MSDSAQTLRGPGPGPLREAALEIARGKIGERETARNQGPIVDWAISGLTSHPAGGDQRRAPGWASWCAFFVCQCYLRALQARGEAPIEEWKRIASGSCTALWDALCAQGDDDQGWAWVAAPNAHDPVPGDLIFFGEIKDGLLAMRHVGIVERADSTKIYTIEGNAGPAADRVCARTRGHGEAIGYARIPW